VKQLQENTRGGDTDGKENTKNNNQMAFIKLSDYTGTIEAVIFNKLFETNKEMLIKDTIIALKGKVSERNGEKSVIIENFKVI